MKGIGGAGMAAIKIAEKLTRNNKVYVLPWWSERPTLSKDNLIINEVEYLRRRVSLKLFINIIKFIFKIPFKATLNFASGFSKIKYSLMYLFDRAYIELLLEQLEIELIHIHGVHLSYSPYMDAAVEKEIPLVCTLHGLNSTNPDVYLDYDKIYEEYALRKISKAKHKAITAVSTTVKTRIVTSFNVPAEQVHVVLNGIDHERFDCSPFDKSEARKRFHIPIEKIVILQVGSLVKGKNHVAVLKAISEMDKEAREELFYVIVGDGREKENLIKFCEKNEIKNCSFFGWISPNGDDLSQLFLSSDFFILPSKSEGLPLVFLEAMAAGLPIITFKDLEGVSDLCTGYNMELIPKRDTQFVIKAIRQATERDWNRDRIREYSRLLSWDNVCKRYYEIYLDCAISE